MYMSTTVCIKELVYSCYRRLLLPTRYCRKLWLSVRQTLTNKQQQTINKAKTNYSTPLYNNNRQQQQHNKDIKRIEEQERGEMKRREERRRRRRRRRPRKKKESGHTSKHSRDIKHTSAKLVHEARWGERCKATRPSNVHTHQKKVFFTRSVPHPPSYPPPLSQPHK